MGPFSEEESFQCPCCLECQHCKDFHKVAEIDRIGLLIYRHPKASVSVDKQPTLGGVSVRIGGPAKDVFIIQNTRNVDITSADLMPTLETFKINCRRCRAIYEHARRLLNRVPNISENRIMGICDHCYLKQSPKSCYNCENIVTKFITAKISKNDSEDALRKWLSKMKCILRDVLGNKTETERISSRASSEGNLNKLSQLDSKSQNRRQISKDIMLGPRLHRSESDIPGSLLYKPKYSKHQHIKQHTYELAKSQGFIDSIKLRQKHQIDEQYQSGKSLESKETRFDQKSDQQYLSGALEETKKEEDGSESSKIHSLFDPGLTSHVPHSSIIPKKITWVPNSEKSIRPDKTLEPSTVTIHKQKSSMATYTQVTKKNITKGQETLHTRWWKQPPIEAVVSSISHAALNTLSKEMSYFFPKDTKPSDAKLIASSELIHNTQKKLSDEKKRKEVEKHRIAEEQRHIAREKRKNKIAERDEQIRRAQEDKQKTSEWEKLDKSKDVIANGRNENIEVTNITKDLTETSPNQPKPHRSSKVALKSDIDREEYGTKENEGFKKVTEGMTRKRTDENESIKQMEEKRLQQQPKGKERLKEDTGERNQQHRDERLKKENDEQKQEKDRLNKEKEEKIQKDKVEKQKAKEIKERDKIAKQLNGRAEKEHKTKERDEIKIIPEDRVKKARGMTQKDKELEEVLERKEISDKTSAKNNKYTKDFQRIGEEDTNVLKSETYKKNDLKNVAKEGLKISKVTDNVDKKLKQNIVENNFQGKDGKQDRESTKNKKKYAVEKELKAKKVSLEPVDRKDNALSLNQERADQSEKTEPVGVSTKEFMNLLMRKQKERIAETKEQKLVEAESKKVSELVEKRLKRIDAPKTDTVIKAKPQIQKEPDNVKKESPESVKSKVDKNVESKKPQEINVKQIKIRRPSPDDLIIQLVKMKQKLPESQIRKKLYEVEAAIIREHKTHINVKLPSCVICFDSDMELELESIEYEMVRDKLLSDIIIGANIFKHVPYIVSEMEYKKDPGVVPLLFQSRFSVDNAPVSTLRKEPVLKIPSAEEPLQISTARTTKQPQDPELTKGIIRYALSDRTFIEKGWTMLPTEKVVRKMNVYKMRPAQPEFDWFEHNKKKRLLQYDSGEKLAEIDDNGRGRWYYRNGHLALDYYDAEEVNANQRFVIYSSGEPDERGRSRPITILATFDYLGNGVVFDHAGKIRLKYNQTEGVVLDRGIGPVSHWKWHTLNDPPVLQQVMIDTQMPHKDPVILKLGGSAGGKVRPENEEMLAIEFDNFVKEKSKKLSQKFKPFQIKMKAMKINEHFSLRVLDQATVYLIFRDGTTNLKLNIGMILDHKEIVDTDTAEVGEVSNSLERFPARTESLAAMQKSVAYAQRYERMRTERERRLCPPEPCASADQMTAAISRPLRPAFRTVHSGSVTTIGPYCRGRKPSSCNVYYNTRLT